MKLYTPKKKKKKIGRKILAIAVLFLIVFVVFRLVTYSWEKFNNWTLIKIKSIEVSCAPPLSQEQVIRISELKEGLNIFTTDLSKAKSKLMEHPWVKNVKIRRSLPDKIRILIQNKKVRAMAKQDVSVYYIDEYGQIIHKMIPGFMTDTLIIDSEHKTYTEALDIINRINLSGWIKEDMLSELVINKDFILLHLADEGTKIYLNRNSLEQSLENAGRIMKDMSMRSETASTIDASISGSRIFIRDIKKRPN